MIPFETTNTLAALGTLGLQIVTILLLAVLLLRARIPALREISHVVEQYALAFGFAVSLGASAVAVYYSAVIGLEPCPLCWWQRAFLFPQVVLFAAALWRRDGGIAPYSIALSAIGALVALYQHVLQMLPGSGLPCPATGVSCAQRVVFELGYITFPLMACSVFAFLVVLMCFAGRRS